MVIELKSEDIEIEQLAPGSIVHILPDGDPYKAAEDILKGLTILKDINHLVDDWDSAIQKEEQPEYIIMAFVELKRVLKDIDKQAEKKSLAVMEKVKKIQ